MTKRASKVKFDPGIVNGELVRGGGSEIRASGFAIPSPVPARQRARRALEDGGRPG